MPQTDMSPAENAVAIDYGSADQTLFAASRALLISTAGNLKVDMAGSGTGITLPVPVGLIPVRISKIYQTGSTAAGVVLW